MQLAGCVVGILNQRLVNRADGKGRVVACEVLVRSPTIEKLILDNKISEIESAMESSNAYYKMQSMNQALEKLVRANIITIEEAISHSDKSEDLRLKLSGMISGGQKASKHRKLWIKASRRRRVAMFPSSHKQNLSRLM